MTRFDMIVSFPHPEHSFLTASAVISVRAFEGDDNSLVIKSQSRDVRALERFFETAQIDHTLLSTNHNPYRSTKYRVPKESVLKAANLQFPNTQGMKVEFQPVPYMYAFPAPAVAAVEDDEHDDEEAEEEDLD